MTFARYALASRWIGVALAAVVTGCGGSDSTGPSESINYGGTWKGTLGDTAVDGVTVTWTAAQSGSTVSGPVALRDPDGNAFAGTVTGAISNAQLAFTVTLPPGTFTPLGGPATCSVSGTGTTTTATATAISASLQLTFSASCIGTITDNATETDQLTLAKQ